MNKNLILLSLGALAIFFLLKKKKRGIIEVSSPKKITEDEFLKKTNKVIKRPKPTKKLGEISIFY
jgi:NAD dependent epimerase/dehydratase family enzyme